MSDENGGDVGQLTQVGLGSFEIENYLQAV